MIFNLRRRGLGRGRQIKKIMDSLDDRLNAEKKVSVMVSTDILKSFKGQDCQQNKAKHLRMMMMMI